MVCDIQDLQQIYNKQGRGKKR